MKKYTTRTGLIQFKPSEKELMLAIELSNGFCLACGAENEQVEPDAARYTCICCNKPKVYGGEELLIMNLYH